MRGMKKGRMTRPLTAAELRQRKAAALRRGEQLRKPEPIVLTQRELEVLYVARRLREREGKAGYGRIAKVFGMSKETIKMVGVRLQKKGFSLG
jgi:uncharacterized Zn finger protein